MKRALPLVLVAVALAAIALLSRSPAPAPPPPGPSTVIRKIMRQAAAEKAKDRQRQALSVEHALAGEPDPDSPDAGP